MENVKKINLDELEQVAGGVLDDEAREKLRKLKSEFENVEKSFLAGKATEDDLNKAFDDFYDKYRALSI